MKATFSFKIGETECQIQSEEIHAMRARSLILNDVPVINIKVVVHAVIVLTRTAVLKSYLDKHSLLLVSLHNGSNLKVGSVNSQVSGN